MVQTMKCFYRLVFVASLVLAIPLTSYALSCAQTTIGPLPLAERVDQYPVIFSGTIQELASQSSPKDHIGRDAFSIYEVTVDEAFKGLTDLDRVRLKTYATAWHLWATADGRVPEYTLGGRYLFLIESVPDGDLVETNMNADCSRDLIIFNLEHKTSQQALAQIKAIDFAENVIVPTPPVVTPTVPEPPVFNPPAEPETPITKVKSKSWFERLLDVLKEIFG